MKINILLIVVLFTSLSFAQIDTITILQVNDTHSCLSPLAPRTADLQGTRGGIARAATVIGMTKMTETNVLTLHGGDLFIGDPTFAKYQGVPEFQLLNGLGFDAMAVGNHEFDLTPQGLQSVLDYSFANGGFPLVSSNTILDGFPTLKNYIKPYVVKVYGNTKVGIFGLTTPETNLFSLPSPVVIDTGIAASVLAMIDSLKAQQCNVIVCLSHLGIENDMVLASMIPDIDVIISSHDHIITNSPVTVIRPDGGTTYITQCGAFYSHVGKLKLSVSGNEVTKLDYQLIELNDQIPEEPQTKSVVDGLVSDIESIYGPMFSQQIGNATTDFEEVADSLLYQGYHDTPVGNLVTDAFRQKENTQIAITVGGSTSQKIFKGPIVPADAFRAIGYGFNTINGLGYFLMTFKLSGSDLMKAFEFCLSTIEQNDELLPQVSGLKYFYYADNPAGHRLGSLIFNNKPVSKDSFYSVTTNQFLFAALCDPGLVAANPVDVVTDTTATEFQALYEYISSIQNISPVVEGRINTIINGVGKEPAVVRNYELKQNYPNPFNPSTTISYSIPVSSQVTLKVYNIKGQLVRTLVNEYRMAGDYKVRFDAVSENKTPLSSGIYLYQLTAGNQIITRKCILLK